VYADDHHPSTGHMHAVMHSDASVISEDVRDEVVKRASNYVEITRMKDGSINIENQYNFGVQTTAHDVHEMPLDKKPVRERKEKAWLLIHIHIHVLSICLHIVFMCCLFICFHHIYHISIYVNIFFFSEGDVD